MSGDVTESDTQRVRDPFIEEYTLISLELCKVLTMVSDYSLIVFFQGVFCSPGLGFRSMLLVELQSKAASNGTSYTWRERRLVTACSICYGRLRQQMPFRVFSV